jgi:Trypsin-co-occurring domain 1
MASLLMEVPLEDTEQVLLVEVDPTDIGGDLVLATAEPGKVAAKATRTLEDSLDALQPALRSTLNRLRSIGPEEIAVEFGLKFGGESGIILAKGTAEVNLTVSMTWRRQGAGG